MMSQVLRSTPGEPSVDVGTVMISTIHAAGDVVCQAVDVHSSAQHSVVSFATNYGKTMTRSSSRHLSVTRQAGWWAETLLLLQRLHRSPSSCLIDRLDLRTNGRHHYVHRGKDSVVNNLASTSCRTLRKELPNPNQRGDKARSQETRRVWLTLHFVIC